FRRRLPGGRAPARLLVLRSARERGAPNELSGYRARRRANGTLVGFEPPLWLCLRAVAASFLERDDVRIFDAALVHPDAREFAARRLRLLRGPRLLATDRTRECGRHYHPLLHGASPGDVAPRLRQRFT